MPSHYGPADRFAIKRVTLIISKFIGGPNHLFRRGVLEHRIVGIPIALVSVKRAIEFSQPGFQFGGLIGRVLFDVRHHESDVLEDVSPLRDAQRRACEHIGQILFLDVVELQLFV